MKDKEKSADDAVNELNFSVDGSSVNDSGVDRCVKNFALCDGHDISRENSEIGNFARLKGS